MHIKYRSDDRKVILRTAVQILRKVIGHTEFGGCQCRKGCNCHETFESIPFEDYRITKKWGKPETYIIGKKQDAYKKFRELTKLHKKWLKEKSPKTT